MPNLTENLMSFSDFRLKVVKRILETIIVKHLSPVRSMLIINSSYTLIVATKLLIHSQKIIIILEQFTKKKTPPVCVYTVFIFIQI